MPHYSDQLSRQSEALPLPITPGGHVLLLWRARSPSPGRQRRHARNFPAGRKRVIPTPEMIPELRKLNGEIRKKIDPGGTNWRRSLCDARPINVSYTNIQIVRKVGGIEDCAETGKRALQALPHACDAAKEGCACALQGTPPHREARSIHD